MKNPVKYLKEGIDFLKAVSQDERIPSRDKKVLLAMIALIISPIDIIPDWIPVIGILDDLVLLAIVLDYFFDYLDENILLSHYPWGIKSFLRLKKFSRVITQLTPKWVKQNVWKFKPDIYVK